MLPANEYNYFDNRIICMIFTLVTMRGIVHTHSTINKIKSLVRGACYAVSYFYNDGPITGHEDNNKPTGNYCTLDIFSTTLRRFDHEPITRVESFYNTVPTKLSHGRRTIVRSFIHR